MAVGVTGCLGFGTSGDSDGGQRGSDDSTSDSTQTEAPDAETNTPVATSTPSGGGQSIEIDGAWRTFQGDTANTGTGTETATGPTANPSADWTVTAEDEMWGDPIIVGDTVLAGSWDNKLYAVSLSSGEKLWTYDTGGSLSYPAAAVSGTVFIGGRDEVAALDIESGEPYWTTSMETGARGGPAVAHGNVYVPTQENLVAFSASDGEKQWQVRTGGPVSSTPHATADTIYFTSNDGNIYAVDTAGEIAWQQFVSDSGGFPSPTVVDGTIYVGWGDGNLYALDTADGSERWTDKTGGAENVAVADGTVYIAGYPLTALGVATQEPVWTTEEPEGIPSNFTVGQDAVYLGTDEAATLAYDRASGEQLWRHQGNYEPTTSLAISDGTLVYGDEYGNLVALS